MKLIFWDIDGTLIKTAKAGLFAFEQAAHELWSVHFDFSTIQASGMTDYYIAGQIVEAIFQRPAKPQEVTELIGRYEALLEAQLHARQGLVLPSVREILAYLHDAGGYLSLLLTGNSRKGAELKLNKYGLATYFDFNRSAFCDGHYTRDGVAACAQQTAELAGQKTAVFVIGDTPNDIRCGKAIGAYTIGVATGTYSLAQLQDAQPWCAWERLPEPSHFVAKLEEAGREPVTNTMSGQ